MRAQIVWLLLLQGLLLPRAQRPAIPLSGALPCKFASPQSMQPTPAEVCFLTTSSPSPGPAGLQGCLQGPRPSQCTCCPGMCTLQAAVCTVRHCSAPACLQGQLEGRGAAQRGWPLRGSLMVSVPDDGLTTRPSMTTVDRDRGVSVVSLATLPLHLPYREPQPRPGRGVSLCRSQTATIPDSNRGHS